MNWTTCKEHMPPQNARLFLLYSNGKISGGGYTGGEFRTDYHDEGAYVYAWMIAPDRWYPVTTEILTDAQS